MELDFEILETETSGTIIKVVGVGGAGGNAVQHMLNRGVQGVDFLCMNTDAQALGRSKAAMLIPLGQTGNGARGGGRSARANQRCAERSAYGLYCGGNGRRHWHRRGARRRSDCERNGHSDRWRGLKAV